jgi:predicted nucleic acid-binding protein
MILIDTSVWIDHLHSGEPALVTLLNRSEVLVHPLVIGELACGNLKNRQEVLTLMRTLPIALSASDTEVLLLIENQQLMGRGIGYIDVHLLAAVLLGEGPRLWTKDKRLGAIAQTAGVAFTPEPS